MSTMIHLKCKRGKEGEKKGLKGQSGGKQRKRASRKSEIQVL